ncbi:MAG: ACT domain-containing protein, partial [Stackebrandtia sp.]
VAVARSRRGGGRAAPESNYAQLAVRPMGEVVTSYHVNLDVDDEPGVLAEVASVFAAHRVSMRTVRQSGRGDDAVLVAVTHPATDAQLSATVEELGKLPAVRRVDSVMRVEGELIPWSVTGAV